MIVWPLWLIATRVVTSSGSKDGTYENNDPLAHEKHFSKRARKARGSATGPAEFATSPVHTARRGLFLPSAHESPPCAYARSDRVTVSTPSRISPPDGRVSAGAIVSTVRRKPRPLSYSRGLWPRRPGTRVTPGRRRQGCVARADL